MVLHVCKIKVIKNNDLVISCNFLSTLATKGGAIDFLCRSCINRPFPIQHILHFILVNLFAMSLRSYLHMTDVPFDLKARQISSISLTHANEKKLLIFKKIECYV